MASIKVVLAELRRRRNLVTVCFLFFLLPATSHGADQASNSWWDKTCSVALDAANKTKEMAAAAKNATGDAASKAWSATADAAGKAKDSAMDAAKKAKEASCETGAKAWTATAEAAGKAKDAAVDAAKKAKDYVGETASSVSKSASSLASEVAQKAGNAILNSIDWSRGNRFTLAQLSQGKYTLLPSEQVLLDRCGKIITALGMTTLTAAREDEALAKARKLMSDGNLQAAIEQYERWQEDWLARAPKAPPLAHIKEAFLAPSTAFALDYLRARQQIKGLPKPELDKCLTQLASAEFGKAIAKRLESDSSLKDIDYVRNVLKTATNTPDLRQKEEVERAAMDVALALDLTVVFGAGPWGMLATKTTADVDKVYDTFAAGVLDAYGKEQNALIENKSLFMRLRNLLEDKERTDKQLEKVLESRLLSPEQVADMKTFREHYRSLYEQQTRLICLYYVDLPLRVKVLCVNLLLDKAKGLLNDDENKVMTAGLGLTSIVTQLQFFTDCTTTELYTDLWRRIKGELSDKEFEELVTLSKFVPDWMKTLRVKDIDKSTDN